MASGRRSRLIFPIENRHGRTVYLSSGQRSLLFYLRSRMRYGRRVFKTAQLAEVAGIDQSNVSRALDRLSQHRVIGHRATRGCLGQTIVFPLKRRVSGSFRANVATSSSFGGYLSRDRWRTEVAAGSDRAVRRLTPPRTLYGRCAAGHRTRLSRLTFRRWPSSDPAIVRSFEGVWSGTCGRCGVAVQDAIEATVMAPVRPAVEQVGRLTGIRTMPGASMEDHHGQ